MNAHTDPRVAALATLTFGTPIEGGFFAGYITLPDGIYGIAVAPKAQGEFKGIWHPKRKAAPGARSCFDCRANTLAMAEAGSELAQRILALDINGCADWSIPSRDVLELLYRNLKPTTQENYSSFRDGDNPSSVPVGYPYTDDIPAQTSAAAFQAGGAEAFEPRWYWASTQSSDGYAWCQTFSYGCQHYYAKTNEFLARAVRRFKV
jgi:hypothetical protein